MPSPAPSDPSQSNNLPPSPGRRSELTRLVLQSQVLPEANFLRNSIKQSAQWFYWIAALSLINSIIALAGGHFIFLAGLAVSQIIDVFAAHMGLVGPYFSIAADLVAAVFICGFGYLTAQGSRNALIVGMILYALDGVIFVLLSAYLPACFHAFVLYQMAQGWRARRQLDKLRAESPTLVEAEAARRDPASPLNAP